MIRVYSQMYRAYKYLKHSSITSTALKQHFPKQKPKAVIQRQFKNFRNDYFGIEIENALLNMTSIILIMIILLKNSKLFWTSMLH